MDDVLRRYSLVGIICSWWASIEYQLAYTIWHLLGVDEATGKIITGGTDLLPRANMAIALARHLKAKPPLIKCLEATRKAIQDGLDSRRNFIVHGVAFADDDGSSFALEIHRGKGDKTRRLVSVEEYHDLSAKLGEVCTTLRLALRAQGIVEPTEAKVLGRKALVGASGASSDAGS